MTEFGDIFDYQLSTMVFGYTNIAFIVAYGFVGIWLTARSTIHTVGTLRPA
jgi:hypothetical protein